MRPDEREALRGRFQYRCGYCGVSERDAGAELTIDHFQPRSQGGSDEPENWVYCCHACNEFKGDFWQPTSLHRILHPLRDDLAAHMVEQEDGTLQALSETGAFHIERLHLNRQ
jgi:5-methylcytosine-specific restriction endonuclease McrA